MTGPVWDGDGIDPWMPARVAAALDAAEAERSIYTAVWEALTAWLVTTSRRLLRGPVLDPSDVFAQIPAWRRAVQGIIETVIVPIMGRAYEGLFGPGYEWRYRPSVVAYLTEVTNRMVRTTDDVFDLVAGQVAAGVTLGEGIPELAARVDQVLSATATERWANRAVTVARTETMGALNGSRADAFDAYAEDSGEPMEKIWLATLDTRTRRTHRIADKDRVPVGEPFMVGGFPLMFPGDPSGPPQEVINCRCTTLLVEVGENVDLSNRHFRRK